MQTTMSMHVPFYASKTLITDMNFGMYEKMIIQHGNHLREYYPSVLIRWKG